MIGIDRDMNSAHANKERAQAEGAPLAKEDLGLGTAYERVAIYKLFDPEATVNRADAGERFVVGETDRRVDAAMGEAEEVKARNPGHPVVNFDRDLLATDH